MSTKSFIVARKDYRDAIYSRTLWSLTILFVLFTAGLAYALVSSSLLGLAWPAFLTFFASSQGGLSAIEFSFFFIGPAQLLVPIAALVITHKAIAGEVESGSVKFLLSVPLSRLDAFLGKVVGRVGVLWTALFLGFSIGGVVVAVLTGRFDLASYAALIAVTFLYGLAYVAIGVALSAATDNGSRAVVYVVGFFVLFEVLWAFVPNVFAKLSLGTFFPPTVGGMGSEGAPGWFFFLYRLSPGGAYKGAATGMVGSYTPDFQLAFPDGVPFYLSSDAALLTLAVWVVVPLALGYYRFKDADIS